MLDQTFSGAGVTMEHELRLTGLAPETTYYYAVGSDTQVLASGSEHTFETAPVPGTRSAFRIWVTGDSGLTGADQLRVRDAYLNFTGGERTDVWLLLGDNAYFSGTDAEYQSAFFDVYPALLRTTVPWSTRGNHDNLHTPPGYDYYDLFTFPAFGEAGGVPSATEAYYSFDFANVHFICLDSEESSNTPGGVMLTWLEDDLASTAQDWIIAYWHHPPYTKGSHDSDAEGRPITMRENVLPLLEAGGVDLVLCGHSHSYERSLFVDGHYGFSSSLDASMIVNSGDGDPAGDGPYVKPGEGPVAHAGTVYAVVGSASVVHDGPMNHPVMETSLLTLGSLVIDVDGDALDARFLDDVGVIRDVFAIRKLPVVDVEASPGQTGVPFDVRVVPNPANDLVDLRFHLGAPGLVQAEVFDPLGSRVATLFDGELASGPHALQWDGRGMGRRLARGAYFIRVVAGENTHTAKVVWTHR